MSNNYPHPVPQQGFIPPNQPQGQPAPGAPYGAPASQQGMQVPGGQYGAPGPQQGAQYGAPVPQQGMQAPGSQFGAPAGSGYTPAPQQQAPAGQYGAPARSGYAPAPQQGGQAPGGHYGAPAPQQGSQYGAPVPQQGVQASGPQFGAPAGSGYTPAPQQQAPGGQYGGPAGSGYAPVPQQQAPGGQYGAPAASSYAPEPEPEDNADTASDSDAIPQPSSDPQPGASEAPASDDAGVPQPTSSVIPQPQAASAYAPAVSTGQPATESTQMPAPDPMTRFEPEARFTSSFQSFVNSAPTMPGPSAAQYPQAAPQQVQSWAMPTSPKKAPVFEAVVIGVGAAMMLVGTSSFLFASGPFLGFFLAIMCLVPLVIILAFLQFVDRFEPEPWWTKIAALLWGGGVAVFFAGITNGLAGVAVASATGSGAAGSVFEGVVAAPLGEEFLKALGVLVIVMMRRHRISSPLDGLVYAGYSAAGFLVVEDFSYFVITFYNGVLAETFIMRVLLGVFGHVMYTSCTGWAIGWAVTRTRSIGAGIGVVTLGYLIAVTMHGLWNGSATISGSRGGFLVLYFIFQVPLFCGWLFFVARTMRRERRDIAAGLMPYVNQGWILPSEVQMVCDPGSRRNALAWVAGGGPAAKRAMKSFMNNLASVGLDQIVMNVRGPEKARIDETQSKIQEATAQRQTFQSLMGIRPM
ncbi:PrsW family glutamic-type intramembrane protease [Actinomyces sp. ICM39]|uniref:PrsW family glutamic-type intramembrane protease n=1 Tax=Actinomyces sp. ICM39 TaxID=1105029 RepID=UPI001E616B93|nr:PrsW family glutamic-type intramembrane protease [Actinomyces sp. ICM39]